MKTLNINIVEDFKKNNASQREMVTCVEIISPSVAKSYLKNTHPNQRTIRKGVVNMYAEQMKKGDWKLSPDGIAFDRSGQLIQGCHRLNAVILAGVDVAFSVTRDVDPLVFSVLDQGLKRSYADALGVPRKKLELVTSILRVAKQSAALTVNDIENANTLIGKSAEVVVRAISSTTRKGMTASVRAAVLLRYIEGNDLAWLAKFYSEMANDDFTAFTKLQGLLWKRLTQQTRSAGGMYAAREAMCLSYKAMDANKQHYKKLLVTESDFDNLRSSCIDAITVLTK